MSMKHSNKMVGKIFVIREVLFRTIRYQIIVWKNIFQIHFYAFDWAFPYRMHKYWRAVETLKDASRRETRLILHELVQEGKIKKIRDADGVDRYYPVD